MAKKKAFSQRTGVFVKQPTGFRAFIPKPLPPDPPIDLTLGSPVQTALSMADRMLGRLDGVASTLPNPDHFVSMYVRQEAVLSSQIEGTQSTLGDVLGYEAGETDNKPPDVKEVVNYVRAMNHGLGRLEDLPLCLRLIREVHQELMQGVRGDEADPGEFRRSQNWIGPPGCGLTDAKFVPPPVPDMKEALADLETFVRDDGPMPVLLRCAVAHAHFETVHPFLDGNGRVGRLLIALMLCERQVLERPLLYLSLYLKQHRDEYYDRLTAVREDGDWEGWATFFLNGVTEISRSAVETARSILDLRERTRTTLAKDGSTPHPARLLEAFFARPVMTARMAEEALGVTYVTARRALDRLIDEGVVTAVSDKPRNRPYRFDAYLRLFDSLASSTDAG